MKNLDSKWWKCILRARVLPGGVVHLSTAVITVKSTAGDIAPGEHLGQLGLAALESASIGGRYRGLGADLPLVLGPVDFESRHWF